jgi:predicted nucleic acid-binding protein
VCHGRSLDVSATASPTVVPAPTYPPNVMDVPDFSLRAEALRAVRHLGPDALAIAREGLRRVDLIAIEDRILDAAGILEPRILRTLDAIHLATALTLGDDLETIVTYDDRMIAGAALLGLAAVAPR